LVAGYLTAFGCQIVAYDPYVQTADGIEFLRLDEVLRAADIVSVHARYTADTDYVISAREIALMKPGAVLINTARSGLVDQAALVQALQQKRIRGAALDVFDTEPIPEQEELLTLDNLTITPHVAGSTADAFTNSPKLFCSRLLQALKGEGALPVVNVVKFK
jgi:D-3-phosphoglycerate dehydrogenase / 2-oxoglutarate reductase